MMIINLMVCSDSNCKHSACLNTATVKSEQRDDHLSRDDDDDGGGEEVEVIRARHYCPVTALSDDRGVLCGCGVCEGVATV